jgi:hypothetical protein
MANMMILFFLFSEGKTEDNLKHIFNLFDADGNKVTYSTLMFTKILYCAVFSCSNIIISIKLFFST